jgi:hypothetical protein
LSMPTTNSSSPISPATKSTPTALNAGAPKPGSPYGSTSPYGAASAGGPGFSMPPTGNLAMGGAGTAAAQNGYSNGPYGMVSNSARPSGFTAPSGYGAAGSPTGYSMPNANVAANTAPGMKPAGYSPTNSFAGAPGMPPAYGGAPAANGMPTMPAAYPSMPGNTVPAIPAAYNSGQATAQSLPPIQSSMPNAVPGGYQPSMPAVATQPYNGSTPYRPGSVGRTTGYDFSSPNAGAVAGGTAQAPAGYSLPPAVPSTANGMPNQTFR